MLDPDLYSLIPAQTIQTDRADLNMYVLKDINKQVIAKKFHDEKDYFKEKKINLLIQHISFIHLINSYDALHCLVFEDGGQNLEEYLSNNGADSEEETLFKFKSVFLFLSQLHKLNIAHNDIKDSNIVISNGHYYLIDFGESAKVDDEDRSVHGTFFYSAPEIKTKRSHDLKADIYSLAVTLYYALTLAYPFDYQGDEAYIQQQLDGQIDLMNLEFAQVSNYTVKIIKRMLDPIPENRPTIDECIRYLYA